MRRTHMLAEQISIFIENKEGRLAEVTAILRDANVNIRALSLADTTDFGVLRLIVNDNDRAETALKKEGFSPADIKDSLAQSRIKETLNEVGEDSPQTKSGMHPSIMASQNKENIKEKGIGPKNNEDMHENVIPEPAQNDNYSYSEDNSSYQDYPSSGQFNQQIYQNHNTQEQYPEYNPNYNQEGGYSEYQPPQPFDVETIGDIDILVTTSKPHDVVNYFTSMNNVTNVLAKGPTKASIKYGNVQIDLRVLPEKEYGSAMMYFTGSKEHNVELRKVAISKGMKLSEPPVVIKDWATGSRLLAPTIQDMPFKMPGGKRVRRRRPRTRSV